MKTVKINFKDLPKHKNPIFNYCRKLLKEGIAPDTKLEIYRENLEPDVIVPNIGKAAKWSVLEDPNLHFAKYIPFNASSTSFKRPQITLTSAH